MELTDHDKLTSVAQRYTELLANPQWIPSRAHAEGLRNMLNTAALTLSWLSVTHERELESLRASLTRVEEESSERMRTACLAVIESERLQECTGEEGDVAYETALDDVEQGIKTICLSRPVVEQDNG